MSFEEQPIELVNGELRLEARYHEGGAGLAAVVMHPHPQYGGDMDNHVVLAACEELARVGASTLRFNFRGTGRSEGSYDNGRAEVTDATAALALVRQLSPGNSPILVGYSFGAMVAAAAANAEDLSALILISPPLAVAAVGSPEGVRTLAVTGDRDTVSPAEAARELASETVRVVIVPGADHGWWPDVDVLRAEIGAFVEAIESQITR